MDNSYNTNPTTPPPSTPPKLPPPPSPQSPPNPPSKGATPPDDIHHTQIDEEVSNSDVLEKLILSLCLFS